MRNQSLEKIIARKRNEENLYNKVKRILCLNDQRFGEIFKMAFKDVDLLKHIHADDANYKSFYKS